MSENIKEWYKKQYPTDTENITDNITFYDLFLALDHYKSIYKLLNIDSLQRERIFEKLAVLMDVDYDYIYNQWLLAEED